MIDYYSILQVNEKASEEDIKQAYHKMARLFHPDNFNGSRELAAEQMAKINEAYNVLSDKKRRAMYDSQKKGYDDQLKEDFITRNENKKQKERPCEDDSIDNYVPEEKQKTTSCLGKIMEWAIYIGIICFIFNRFDIGSHVKGLLNDAHEIIDSISNEQSSFFEKYYEPDDLVKEYFNDLKKGKIDDANNCFSKDADQNFQGMTVAEYNQVIGDLYYSFEADIPTYPLFEAIRKFSYKINNVTYLDEQQNAEVYIDISNYDVALIFGLVLAADGDENKLEKLSDSKMQKVYRNAINLYGNECVISTSATFELTKEDGSWKIYKISPMKDFSTVFTGQASDMVLAINGENPNNPTQDPEAITDDMQDEEDFDETDESEEYWDETDEFDEESLEFEDEEQKEIELGEYILPGSGCRIITEDDLEGFLEGGCRMARNEIYARHGRIFEDEELNEYFQSKSWYEGYLTADEFDDSVLSDIERKNLDTIVNYEKEHGYR